jgi:hypothetical protein
MVRVSAKPFVAGAFAMLLGSTMLTTSAQAGVCVFVGEDTDDDGSTTELWQDTEDGHEFIIMISADGVYSLYDPPDNPNPDDESTGPGSHSDKPDVVKLIELGGASYKVRIAPADSPELMAHLRGLQGGGLGPRYNPSDDDNGNGPGAAPGGSMEVKKTPDEIRLQIEVANIIANERATLEGAMGDGDEGGGEGPTGFNKNGPGTGDDDGDYTEGQNKTVGKTEKDLLGAKPEVVNPPHTSGGGRSATGGGSTSGGSTGAASHGNFGGSTHG